MLITAYNLSIKIIIILNLFFPNFKYYLIDFLDHQLFFIVSQLYFKINLFTFQNV